MVRGCGTRQPGGIYAETVLGDVGMPFDFFICDSPHPVDPDWGVAKIGVKQVECDLIDCIGSTHYPNVLDFIEEGRRFGVSRRLSPRLDFERITAKSKMLFIHDRGIIENWTDIAINPKMAKIARELCPKMVCERSGLDALGYSSFMRETRQIEIAHRPFGHDPESMCAGYWWADVDGLDAEMVRKMPEFSYQAAKIGPKRIYSAAVVLILPITNICVIDSSDTNLRDERLDIASASGLKVELKDE